MTENTTDTTVSAVMKDTAPGAIYPLLQAALKAQDVPVLQVLVPGLTRPEAACLLFHTTEQERRYAAGQPYYGRETWGAQVPAVVHSATRQVRIVGLRSWHPSLSREEAARIVERNMAQEVEAGTFWRRTVDVPASHDLDRGRFLEVARAQAITRAVIFRYRAELRAAHAAALQALEAAGLPWALLAEWHRGNHGEEDAVERQAQRERDAQVEAA